MDDILERTTSEVIQTLGDDCDRCHEELMAAIDAGNIDSDGYVDADYEYHARKLIRAIFAYIEALTFSVKAWSANHCLQNEIAISPQERYFSVDIEYEINDKGEVVESVAKLSLAKNIRFAIALHRKAKGIESKFDASVEWWSCLKRAVKIRDRLTHPKMPGDLDVSGEDILCAIKAKNGLEQELVDGELA